MAQFWVSPETLYKTTQYKTSEGEPFVQVFQWIPALEQFYTDYEKNFDVQPAYNFIRDNGWIALSGTALYLSFLYFGQKWMAGRDAFNVKGFTALWNLFLAVFSIIGMIRVVPHFFFLVSHRTFRETICLRPDHAGYGDGAAGLWIMLFTVSKVFELLDTVFLILKKKNVMFLHWYHHATVLLYTWFSYSARNSGLYFIAMNYSVHACMYTYYFLMEIKMMPKWFNPMWITIAQINQMFVGVGVTVAAFLYHKEGNCEGVVDWLLPYCCVMYATYLYFFVEFFFKRFFGKKSKGASKAKKAA